MTKRSSCCLLPYAALLLALIFAPGTPAQASQNSQPLDLGAYAAQLRRCASALPALRQDPAKIPSFRQSLPAEWDVRAGGRNFHIPTAWLDSALAQIAAHPADSAAKWRAIHERLTFLREQAEALASPDVAPSPAVAGKTLDAIFRGREFRGLAGPGPLALWWRRLGAWIDGRIAWLLARLHLGAISGNVVAYGLIAVALLFLSLWSWRGLAGRARDRSVPTESQARQPEKRRWEGEALAAAGRGEFRQAIRFAYWAAVARLEEQGAFVANRSQTPRELLRRIAGSGREREPFRELTESYEVVWYGNRSPSPADWENTKTQLERIGCQGVSTPPTAGS